jgi:two-component system, chemotaxis family, CheB/CheR fusion protein
VYGPDCHVAGRDERSRPAPQNLRSENEQARLARRSLRILVADDDRDEVAMLVALLRDEGHEVRGVYDGKAVAPAARLFDPEIYLIDIAMPRMTGYDVARAIREEYGKAPVLIAVTASARVTDRLAATLAGFDHHVAKPFDPQALIELLRDVSGAAPD